MRIIIAEKPTVANYIAEFLGNVKKQDGYLVCSDSLIVTWCLGHLLEAKTPDLINPAYKLWSLESLPILQEQLSMSPVKRTNKQFNVIKKLLKDHPTATVIHACDADREGQLIGDEILYFCNWQATQVQRMWLDSLTDEEVAKAYQQLKPNTDYSGLFHAAQARQLADWCLGMNLSRFFTLKSKEASQQNPVISVGRVQTPTLALVVARDIEKETFKPKKFYIPIASIETKNGKKIRATWLPSDGSPVDEERRLVDKEVAEKIAAPTGKEGVVLSVQTKDVNKTPPLPFDLQTLQKEANSVLSFTAVQTLETAQSLYLKKTIMYPRTECAYLPEDLHAKAPECFSSLEKIAEIPQKADANFRIKSPAWNSKKVVAHNGIIPTGSLPTSKFTQQELALFSLIVDRYYLQFYPSYTYTSITLIFQLGTEKWSSSTKKIIAAGWTKRRAEEEQEKSDNEKLDELPHEGEVVTFSNIHIEDKTTTPQAHYNDSSLIDSMASVHRFVTNPKLKAQLKEVSGIGTPATRAAIIQEIERRGYVERKGKNICATPLGRQVISLIPPEIADPGYTAILEDIFKDIAEGKKTLPEFTSKFLEDIKELISSLKTQNIQFTAGEIFPCPECGDALKRLKKKGANSFYWACFNSEKHISGKPVFFPDKKGKPADPLPPPTGDAPKCEYCGSKMRIIQIQQQKTTLWACFGEEHPEKHPGDSKNNGKRKAYFLPFEKGKTK